MNFVTKHRYGWQAAAGAGLAILLGVSGGGTAWAQAGGAGGSGAGGASGTNLSCADTTMFPSPIIITGSSAFEPTAKVFAAKAASLTPPRTIIYNGTGSCVGVGAVMGGGQALTNTGHAYKADGTQVTCSFDTALKADLAVSDVFYESCGLGARPATIGDFQGPVQAMLLIVAASNTAVNAISASQAASIWGCGAAGNVGMFTDDGAATFGILQRSATSGTQILVAKNIGVPEGSFKGHPHASGGDLIASMKTGSANEPMQVIGFVAADSYKTEIMKSTPIHSLAFQGIGQTMAYYADSTASANDRRNVRDGHYVIAGPEHLIVPLTNGAPSANAQKFIDWVNGNTMIDAANPNAFIDLEATAGTIPQCAMKVTHTSDGGPLAPYTPCKPCGCYYEAKANAGAVSPSCVACSATAPCAGGKTCSYGYCE